MYFQYHICVGPFYIKSPWKRNAVTKISELSFLKNLRNKIKQNLTDLSSPFSQEIALLFLRILNFKHLG